MVFKLITFCCNPILTFHLTISFDILHVILYVFNTRCVELQKCYATNRFQFIQVLLKTGVHCSKGMLSTSICLFTKAMMYALPFSKIPPVKVSCGLLLCHWILIVQFCLTLTNKIKLHNCVDSKQQAHHFNSYLDWSHDCVFPELPVVSGHVPQVAQWLTCAEVVLVLDGEIYICFHMYTFFHMDKEVEDHLSVAGCARSCPMLDQIFPMDHQEA